ncbi:GIY-YIG nuclease family protein [Xenorhabdus griffiniae]|uniref:GIY-YIG nuclease family protein n=1 Tax=Xenorhabdus griffiniae TaxID=351672 RepID=A0ABY9XKN8_9GAMM|nr:GIY-YIG nuclease family protein [Xenorhabdus griffiniae]MBD1229238.1 GIY-YIG nuclease family protein [Xenorhabdus griffiniae]MBE8588995.1 GIY-YIG nuclease family protein [Xenorhabdus griffiniae]WMV73506.1 GIY-YIG nuclease family protein [Xenorhabdus griffiniae]WNH03186.1 GIY-YIG nuclease family protein [Xenorhabdus griffiniae]
MHLEEMEVHKGIITHAELSEGFRVEGWVYVLSNKYMPGIYKVGMTTTSPEARAKELASATGVPCKFEIAATFYSRDPSNDEATVHDMLFEFRINESREFFDASLEEIIAACEGAGLVKTGEPVERIADYYDVICTEKLNELNLDALFESLGVSIFGCKLSVADRLIRFAVKNLIEKNRERPHSLFFQNGTAYLIQSEVDQMLEAHLKEQAAFIGPRLPVPSINTITDVPF